MKTLFLLLPLLTLGAAQQPEQENGAGRRCLVRTLVAAPVALDDGSLFFRGQPDRRRSFRAVFKGRCTGLNRFAAVTVETTARGYCEGDKVRVFVPPTRLTGPACVIDRLEPAPADAND